MRVWTSGTFGGFISQGFAVNDRGQVAGESSLPGEFPIFAFLWANGFMTNLGSLGGSYSTAVALNDAGQVAGNSLIEGDAEFEAFLYSDGRMNGLGSLGGGGSFAVAMNQSGMVAGDSFTADFDTRAFLYRDGVMVDLGTLGGYYSSASGINEAGVVVGEAMLGSGETHAFRWSDGTMQDLGTLGGAFSSALSINEAGQVLGVSELTPGGSYRGFVYQDGRMTDLGSLGGAATRPKALNRLGQVVGESELALGGYHAFLWQNGAIIDLNLLLPPGSGWELLSADYIDDTGRIVGAGFYQGAYGYFALMPGTSGNTAPVAVVEPLHAVQCGPVTLDGSRSSDTDGDALAYEWSQAGVILGTEPTLTWEFPSGTSQVLLRVTDRRGASGEAVTTVVVADTVAPTIVSIAATPGELSPPNHQMVAVELTVNATDQCGRVQTARIVDVRCDAPTEPGDIQITGDLTLMLRAFKAPTGDERNYEVLVECRDTAGNVAKGSTTIRVPKSSGPGKDGTTLRRR